MILTLGTVQLKQWILLYQQKPIGQLIFAMDYLQAAKFMKHFGTRLLML